MLIDTHCHLDFDSFDADRDDVVLRAAQNGVTRIIIPATDLDSAKAACALAQKYAGVYAAVGVHPNSTADYTPSLIDALEENVTAPKMVAIGEIGLDYYRDWSPKAQQWHAFEDQLTLAARRELPVIIHNREASEDVISILSDWVKTLPASLRERPGVLHSFSASPQIAEQALDLGFYLGFTGPITFKNAEETRRIAARVPLDRLLVETDAPFLAPMPHRGGRNEPDYVRYVADRLAALHHVSFEQMSAQTTQNAERLFQLPQLT